MIFNKLARLPLSYPNDLEGIHFVLDPNNAELNGVYVTANNGTPRLVASLDGSKWLVSGANTIAPKYGKHIDASIIDNLDTVLNISSYMKTSDYVSVNGNTAIKHVDYALNSTNDRDGNNIINTYATKSEIPSLVEYVTKTYLNTYVEVKRGPDDNYVTAAEKIYWNAKQQALGFTPEMQGVAASLITTLKGGVGTAGDTLKKLYDLYLSGYSEFTVANTDARNNFNITKLPTNIFVLDDGDTKWALYKAITTGTNANYVKLSDPDLLNSVMTASQIAASYESVANVNRFTDILKAKLDSITSIFTTELKTIYDGNTNWISTNGASLITNSHVHSNKSILDLIVGTNTGYLKMNGTGLVFDNSTFSQSNHNHNLNDLSEKSYLSLTNKPTLLSQFTNDLGNYGSFVTGTPWTGYGYLTGITGTQVTTALGYTPYNSTNPNGYISNITKSQVEGVLTGLITTHTHNYLSSFTETDPIFTAWNKSTGISITKSQVSDFPTSLSQFTNNLGNYGSWITGINSGMVTTALGYTPLPTRTFGSAANNNTGDFYAAGSTVANSTLWNGFTFNGVFAPPISGLLAYDGGNSVNLSTSAQIKTWLGLGSSAYTNTNDHILNQNSSAQSANMWISGDVVVGNPGASNTGLSKISLFGAYSGWPNNNVGVEIRNYNGDITFSHNANGGATYIGGAATFASTVNANQLQSTVTTGTAPLTVNSTTIVGNLNAQYLNGNPSSAFQPIITGLSTNYIPKWNGSSMVNSLISDDGTYINTFGKLDTNLEFKTGSNRYIGFGSVTNWNYYLASSGDDLRVYDAEGADFIKLFYSGGVRRVSIPLTTSSTSPTNGALVVGGGIGANHIQTNYAEFGSNLGLDNNGLYTKSNATYRLYMSTNGNIQIGYTIDQGYKLAVNGSGYFNGTINATNYIGKSNGFYTVQITQAAYNALGTKDASTIYMIVG